MLYPRRRDKSRDTGGRTPVRSPIPPRTGLAERGLTRLLRKAGVQNRSNMSVLFVRSFAHFGSTVSLCVPSGRSKRHLLDIADQSPFSFSCAYKSGVSHTSCGKILLSHPAWVQRRSVLDRASNQFHSGNISANSGHYFQLPVLVSRRRTPRPVICGHRPTVQ